MSHLLSFSCLCLAPNPKITAQRQLASPMQSSSGSKKELKLHGHLNSLVWLTKNVFVPPSGRNLLLLLNLYRRTTRLELSPGVWKRLDSVPSSTSETSMPCWCWLFSHLREHFSGKGAIGESSELSCWICSIFQRKQVTDSWRKGVNAWANLMVRALTWEARSLPFVCPYRFTHFI